MSEDSEESALDDSSTASTDDALDMSSQVVSTPNDDSDDDYSDEAVPIVGCCVLGLLIIMIILLSLIARLSATDYNDDDDDAASTLKYKTAGKTKPTKTPASTPGGNSPPSRATRKKRDKPSPRPSNAPSTGPSDGPTHGPHVTPGISTPGRPGSQPTARPGGHPTEHPGGHPTAHPGGQPTAHPGIQTTARPGGQTTARPGGQPTARPGGQPTARPGGQPTARTGGQPTVRPGGQPTVRPGGQPTARPGGQPTARTGRQPTARPGGQPTARPGGPSTGIPGFKTTTPSYRPHTLSGRPVTPSWHAATGPPSARTAPIGPSTPSSPASGPPSSLTSRRALSTSSATPPTQPVTVTPPYASTSRPGKPLRNFTLICVFEYITRDIWNKTDQCTDYVYIRAFYYAINVNHEPLVFTRKTLTRRTHILYYDDPMYWYNLSMADNAVNFVQRLRYAHADWYLGMWGATFVRLLTSLWDTDIVHDSLYELTHRMWFGPINSSRFDGFAVINTIIKDMRGAYKVEQQYNDSIFKGPNKPIIRSDWTYLHTAAVWPGGQEVVTDRHIRNFLSAADIVGLSTSNTTDEPNTVQSVGASPRFLWASPPNPIRGILPGIRGMLDMLQEFSYYKRLLNQDRICFSISSSINYARNLYRNIDFRMEMEDMDESVIRYTRYRFTSIDNHTNQFPLDSDNFMYEFNDTTYTHFWSLRVGGYLKGFFAYDSATTIAYKINELLDAYPGDRCVVFDDLGDDMWESSFTHNGRTISFQKYEMLHAISSAMVQRYGPAFPPKYY